MLRNQGRSKWQNYRVENTAETTPWNFCQCAPCKTAVWHACTACQFRRVLDEGVPGNIFKTASSNLGVRIITSLSPLNKHIWTNRSLLAIDQRTRTCWGTEGAVYENVFHFMVDPTAISVAAPHASSKSVISATSPATAAHTNVHKLCKAR